MILAGNGTVLEVGLVPGKMGDDTARAESIKKLAELLDVSEEAIQNALGASYVQDDSFVPIKKIAKGNEEKEAQLLTIPGVMLNDSQDRVYPLGAAAGHLTGYVQAVTAEDLEKLENKGYHANSVIGRSAWSRLMRKSFVRWTAHGSLLQTKREIRSRRWHISRHRMEKTCV